MACEPPLNVLVIDDTPEDRMAVRLALEAGGFMLQEAADAKHGLKLAGSSTPDCILLDYVLPDAEGLELLESLRKPGGTLPCAVIMLTGAGMADVATAAMKAGALDYLVKDRFEADTLRRAIRSAVQQFRLIEAQRVAERRNAQLVAMVAASSDAIISVGSDLVVQTWNAGAERMFGYGEAEARGRMITELIVPDAYEAERAAIYAAAVSRGAAVLKETVRRHKDGRLFPVEFNVSPILDGSGVTGFSLILRNISERRRVEDALRRHIERQAMLLEVTSDLIRASEPGELSRRTFEHISSAFGAVVCTNYRLDLAGQRLRLVFVHGIPPEHLEAAQSLELGQEYCGTVAASCQPLVANKLRIASDRNAALVRALGATAYACYPLKASDGRLLGTFAVASATREGFTDDEVAWLGTVTNFLAQAWERLEVEQGLRVSEARFRATFENAAVGIAHLGPDLRWLRANAALCRILGYPVDELVTKSLQDITHPADLAADLAQLERMLDGTIDSYDMDKRYLRKDGTIVWGRLTVGCVRKDESIDYFVSVVEDISERKQAEEELRKSEERFRSSLLHSPLPIVLFDDQEQILAFSQSWLEETGYSREELHRIEDWTARACGERSGEVLGHIRRIISTEPGAERAEHMIRTKDGRERLWSFVSSALGTQSDGRRLFVCMAQDVTARKAHEEHVQLLMREISHRAKNMLSLVQAIARQTATREPEDFIGRFTERIQALAANQDLLVRNEWQGVDVEDLVRAQLAHFADLLGSRIAVDGPKLRLNAAAAQAIGLALHELATNAGKYGALSADAGRVDVRWRLDDDTFTMSWTERNGPPASPPDRRGFGSTVIDSMARMTLGGEVQLDYAPAGLAWRVTCPATNALELGREKMSNQDAST